MQLSTHPDLGRAIVNINHNSIVHNSRLSSENFLKGVTISEGDVGDMTRVRALFGRSADKNVSSEEGVEVIITIRFQMMGISGDGLSHCSQFLNELIQFVFLVES